jgi:para-aminobenzoate synthetase component 1
LECQPRLSREEYLERVEALRRHIRQGDCYEINFCLEYFASARGIDPTALYRQLSRLSPNPFAAYYKSGHSHLVCASPERFIQKMGSHIISQPIKGTSPRHPGDREEDLRSRVQLRQSAKDRSENVMVVDLVRNDLSRVCMRGSVKVEELYGVYAYPQVYQMISTVGGELDPTTGFADIVAATFPMGSMTGAPKHRVMELIDRYEPSNRGLFSGAVGYIDPSGDFDFNVVIRSLFYNDLTGYLSFFAGSGITWYSQPEMEYEECLLKARAMMRVLGNSNDGEQEPG